MNIANWFVVILLLFFLTLVLAPLVAFRISIVAAIILPLYMIWNLGKPR